MFLHVLMMSHWAMYLSYYKIRVSYGYLETKKYILLK